MLSLISLTLSLSNASFNPYLRTTSPHLYPHTLLKKFWVKFGLDKLEENYSKARKKQQWVLNHMGEMNNKNIMKDPSHYARKDPAYAKNDSTHERKHPTTHSRMVITSLIGEWD